MSCVQVAVGALDEEEDECGGPLLREHSLVLEHEVWQGLGVWECAFFQLFSRETSARAADLYAPRPCTVSGCFWRDISGWVLAGTRRTFFRYHDSYRESC